MRYPFSAVDVKVEIVERKWTMRVLYEMAGREAMNFSEFQRIVGSPPPTSKCLKRLAR